MDQEVNPFIQKILDYAKGKAEITYDEISVLVGRDFLNSSDMEQVLQLLAKENIEVVESGLDLEDEEEDDEDISVEDDEDVPDGEDLDDEDIVDEAELSGKDDKIQLVNGARDFLPRRDALRHNRAGVLLPYIGGVPRGEARGVCPGLPRAHRTD